MGSKRIKTTTVTDCQTGEVSQIVEEKTVTIKTDTEPFFLTYTRFMAPLYEINSIVAIKVLWKFLEKSEYNTGEVALPSERKKQIIDSLEISVPAFDKAVKLLKDKGIITGSRGLFKLNDDIYWKGDKETRRALERAKLQVSFKPVY